ncbi:hypothetical protein VYU27_006717 [Nannochloropsis oceanica]
MRSESQPLLGNKKKNRPGPAQASSPPLNVPSAGAGGGGFVSVVPDPNLLLSPSQQESEQQQQEQAPYPHLRRSSLGNVLDFSQGVASGAFMHRASLGGGGAPPPFPGAMSLPASPPFEAGPVMHFVDGDRGDDGQTDRSGSGRGSELLQGSPSSTYRHAHTHSHPLSSQQSEDVGLLSGSLHRSTTVGPGSYIPASAHHMMEMMTTPGRGGGATGGLGATVEDGGGGRGGGGGLGGSDNGGGSNNNRSSNSNNNNISSNSNNNNSGNINNSGSLNKGRPEPHIEEAMFDLDPDFDLSAPHLMKMFNMLDRDHNGRLTYEELREGLLSMRGMHTIPAARVDQIIRRIDKDESYDISQEEFVAAFQHLATKAMAMSSRRLGRPSSLLEFFVYDYGPDTAVCRWVYSRLGQGPVDEQALEASLDDFFQEPIEDVKGNNVRWISITGLEPSVVVRLANRYHLHPLQLEDVLTCDKERMKSTKTGSVHQVIVGRATLTESSQGYPQIRKEQVTLFLLEDRNTVISIQKTPSEINSLLLGRIMYAGSKIRLNGPRFLAYALVDSIVDELFPILRLMRKKLKALHSDVTSMRKTSLESVHLIQHIIREVNLLLLWLSPLGTVTTRLQAELPTEKDDCIELKKHLEDLGDHVHALKEQTSSMVGWAKSLNDEYLNEQQYRMNQVIYLLTMVTVMCLPAQFLTGVFGMNFEHFPLLKSPDGFLIFWLMTGSAIVVIMVVFRLKSWM